jgi:cystathionine gamma-synthase
MSTKTLTTTVLGSPVPPFTAHAISVSLPTWKDNVGYEEGEKRVVDSMVTGYPRFFIHRSIQKVCGSFILVHLSPSLPNVILSLLTP